MRVRRIIRILSLYSGHHSWTNHLIDTPDTKFVIVSIDNNETYSHNTTLIKNMLDVNSNDIFRLFEGYAPDIILASPPCTTFSIASCGKHWHPPTETGLRVPKSEEAVTGLMLLDKVLSLIDIFRPKYYAIENPRGLMRKMKQMDLYPRRTVWYCQYGETDGILRAKPTDIWTNAVWKPRPVCKNNNPNCNHVRAPRGAKTGTQGMKNNAMRSLIPTELTEEILDCMLKFGSYDSEVV